MSISKKQPVLTGFWKKVYWLSVIVVVINTIRMPFDSPSLWEGIMLILSGVSLMPLYGYAHQVAIGSRLSAIIIFLLNLPGALLIIGTTLHLLYVEVSILSLMFLCLLMMLLGVLIYPLYAYAFRSEHIWSETTNDDSPQQ